MAADGLDIPDAIAEPPELYPELEPVWEAFAHLSRGRAWIMGFAGARPLRLAFQAIDDWADRMGPNDPDGFMRWLDLIEAADEAWMEVTLARIEAMSER